MSTSQPPDSVGGEKAKNDAAGRAPSSTSSSPEIVEKYIDATPTDSHALAQEALEPGSSSMASTATTTTEQQGAAQIDHGQAGEVKDLGWDQSSSSSSSRPQLPMVGGLPDEQLWTLVRRFDKQVFEVRSLDDCPLAGLDMNIADAEDFSPDKLRAQLERLYMTVGVSLFAAYKHVVRLRSWREWQRTSTFLAVYAAAWLLDLLVPTLISSVVVLVVYPPARLFCFPPAPPSLINPRTGGVQKPLAGVLASDDSVTGAPEKHQGEAVEHEAHSFVNSISTLVLSTAAGKHPQGDPTDDSSTPDPTGLTADITGARDKALGVDPSPHADKTKKPVAAAVWGQARPLMRAVADLVDTWERLGNALSATPPFPRMRPRLTLASCLVPLLVGSYCTTAYMLVKGLGFAVGAGFFADPVIQRVVALADRTYPRWKRLVELRHTILKGIPTNAQLTITLLRIGERNSTPIPPPPSSTVPPPDEAHATAGQDLDHLGATNEDIQAAVQPSTDADAPIQTPKSAKPHRIINFLRGTTKGGVQTALTADKAKALVRHPAALNRLGVVRTPRTQPGTGPVRFPARYRGQKGHAYLTSASTSPALSWTADLESVRPAWTAAVGDVAELRKVGGLGWKTKIVVGWAMDREVVDGLVVKTKDGREMHLTAVVMRDALFNRLASMGTQMWEAW